MKEIKVSVSAVAGLRFLQDCWLHWLASKSTGTIVYVGCGTGQRLFDVIFPFRDHVNAKGALRFNRRGIGVDWSKEHRIPAKYRKPVHPQEIGAHFTRFPIEQETGPKFFDADPASLVWPDFQPLGLVVLDYDKSLDGLKRACDPLIPQAGIYGAPNVAIAWMGYHAPDKEEPNHVVAYVNMLNLGDTYHLNGADMAFKIFNPTPEVRQELRELCRI